MLGPLEVASDEGPINLGGPKPRLLVAILLAARGAVVSASSLAEDLWAGEPPASAAPTLQAYVSRLRGVLPAGVLQSEAGGYRLVPGPDELDADRFESGVAAARAARAVGDREQALRQFDAADRLWRGDAFPELADAPTSRPEAARLDELRLTAREERFELELEAGRHAEAVPELEAAARRHPLREGLHALLMLALYRSGRQTDALRAFQSARAYLAEHVGLDPGPELSRLEAAILSQDPSLDLGAAGAAPGLLAPAELPSPLTTFLGRSAELADLAAFVGANRLVTLVGAGGAGKSRLALEVAADWTKARADSWVALVELVAVDHPDSILPALRATLGMPTEGPSEVADVAGAIGQSSGLLILDNAEHLLEATASMCTSLLTACPRLRVLVTSRAALGAAGEAVWRLGGLAPAEAVRLFSERAGRIPLPEAGEVEAVCARLDGLPLPIELAAARLRHMTFASLVAGLEDRLGALDEPGRSDRVSHHRTVTASVEWSLGLLSETDLQLAQVASIFEGGFDAAAIAEVASAAGLGGGDVRAGLARLVDNSLVELESSGRYRMLETVRAVSSRLLDAADHRPRVADAHLAWVERLAVSILDERVDEAEWFDKMRDELPNTRAALAWALGEGGRPDDGLRIATRAGWLFHLQGPLEEGIRWLEACLPRATKGTPDYMRALNQLAVLAWSQADPAAARPAAEEALQVARDLGDLKWVAIGLNLLGVIEGKFGSRDEARKFDEEALAIARGLDADTLGTCLVNLAVVYLDGSEFEHAAELLQEAVQLFEKGDPSKRAAAFYNLASTHMRLGDYSAAEECLRIADALYRRVGDAQGVSEVLAGRANAALAQGRPPEAMELIAEAVRMSRERGDQISLVDQLVVRAKAQMATGSPNAAGESLEEALSIQREIGSRLRTPEAMGLLARLAADVGSDFEARAYAEQALSVAQDLNNPADVAEALAVLELVTDRAQGST